MVKIISVTPTIYLKKESGRLLQLLRCKIINDGKACSAAIQYKTKGIDENISLGEIPCGESVSEFFIIEPTGQTEANFILKTDLHDSDQYNITLKPPKHWTAHVIQLSHHDAGYTDIASNVLKGYLSTLNEAIDITDTMIDYPDDAKFRIVIEQAWSLDHFLKNASESRAQKMISLLRSGQFEMTALFGNMVTELCGHETLIRTLYHTRNIARKYDIPVISAEHDDTPGFSWGLSRLLTDAGIKLFCPGLPLFYSWVDIGMKSFWDYKKIMGYDAPGAFWWEAPTGRKILFWTNHWGTGGDYRPALPDLEEQLVSFEEKGYPYDVIRWPVASGHRDNSPYIREFAENIYAHNEKWAYPRLISSTNSKFYSDLKKQIPNNLPVWRGELPVQDFLTGSMSSSIPTGINKQNHAALTSSEKLASIAELHTGMPYPKQRLDDAYEETHWYEEHAWAYHFPAGPAQRAGELEKELHTYKAQAFSREVSDKAMARIVDNLKLDEGEMHLVIFNMSPWEKTAPVSVPMREYDSTGSVMTWVPPEKDEKGAGFYKGYLLGHRFHVTPDECFTHGRFTLEDLDSEVPVNFITTELKNAMEPVPYAPQRFGLGSGTRRYGFFEDPIGLKKEIRFIAKDVPAFGYKVYKLIPQGEVELEDFSQECRQPDKTNQAATLSRVKIKGIHQTENSIENEFYRISTDGNGIVGIFDKEAGRELIDTGADGFYKMLVREGNAKKIDVETVRKISIEQDEDISGFVTIVAGVTGHPEIIHKITLYNGIKNIYFETSVLKDATPMLSANLGFIFKAFTPTMRYESSLSIVEPVKDFLPGAYSDAIGVQSWVGIQDSDYHILWSSIDAPVISYGQLRPGYISPAQRCTVDDSIIYDPQTEEDYQKNGWIYSLLFHNNFSTNFAVSQCGVAIFRYIVTTGSGKFTDSRATRWGWQCSTPFETMFTDRAVPDGSLPVKESFLSLDANDTAIINWKKAEDGNGYIIRLWNFGSLDEKVKISFMSLQIKSAYLINLAEQDIEKSYVVTNNTVEETIGSNEIVNIRIIFEKE